jgi:hypothetical protein
MAREGLTKSKEQFDSLLAQSRQVTADAAAEHGLKNYERATTPRGILAQPGIGMHRVGAFLSLVVPQETRKNP